VKDALDFDDDEVTNLTSLIAEARKTLQNSSEPVQAEATAGTGTKPIARANRDR
jgi:hypothetical protein